MTSRNIFQVAAPINTGIAEFTAQPGHKVPELEDHTRQKRYALCSGSPRWNKAELRWHFKTRSLPDYISESTVKSIINKSLNMWSTASGLKFRETIWDSKADIHISFEDSVHKINSILCARLKNSTIAHAFAPYDIEEKGQLHLNKEKIFSTNGAWGTVDLFQTITHELGHVLGLAHSQTHSDPLPAMNAYYQYVSDYKLQQDDINGIKKLYQHYQKKKPTNKRYFRFLNGLKTPLTPSFCTGPRPIDAAFEAPDSTAYVLHDNTYTQFNKLRMPISEGLIQDIWKEVEVPVDAAYANLEKNRVFFFKSPHYWRYTNGELDAGFPKLLDLQDPNNGDSINKIDAAIKSTESDDRIYLFKGDQVYSYDDITNSIQNKGTIETIKDFGGINAAARIGDLLHIFQRNKINVVRDANFLPLLKGNGSNEILMDLSDFFQCPPSTLVDSNECTCTTRSCSLNTRTRQI